MLLDVVQCQIYLEKYSLNFIIFFHEVKYSYKIMLIFILKLFFLLFVFSLTASIVTYISYIDYKFKNVA